jgi:hypothetical protein
MNDAKKTRKSWWWILLAVFLGVPLLGRFVNGPPVPAAAPAPAPVPIALGANKKPDPVVIAATMQLELRDAMRNPDSFKIEQILAMPNGATCYQYRAENGFGGVNRERAVFSGLKFKVSGSDGFSALWNRNCVGKTGQDITDNVQIVIRVSGK